MATVNIYPSAATVYDGWNNIANVGNNSSNYANSADTTYKLHRNFTVKFSADKINTYVPVGATISNVTVKMIAKLSDTGTGTVDTIGYAVSGGSLIEIDTSYSFGTSWTTITHSLGNVNPRDMQLGFLFTNNRFGIRQFHVQQVYIVITYTPPKYTLTVNSNNTNYGTVTGGGSYNQGATATLTATAKTRYRFVKWNDGNTQNPRTVTVNGAATYTATFEPLKYYLDLNGWIDEASSGGISPAGTADVYINGSRVADDVTDFNTQYNYGSTYEIKDIKANSGWIYAGVKTGSLTGTITAATSVVLIFNRIQLPEILSVEIAPNPANTGQGLTIKVKTN